MEKNNIYKKQKEKEYLRKKDLIIKKRNKRV